MSNSSIWPIDRTLSDGTTPGHCGPRSYGNEEVLCLPQSSSITEASPSNCLVSYPGHSLGKSYPSTDMQWVYSAALADQSNRVDVDFFFVEWYISLSGLFNTKVILVELQWYYLTHDWGDKGFMPFPKESEYINMTIIQPHSNVQHVSHNTTGTPSQCIKLGMNKHCRPWQQGGDAVECNFFPPLTNPSKGQNRKSR